MERARKRTPLFDWHKAGGAHMMEFGGFEMPLWYPTGAKREHLSVLTQAGLFDTSHMSVLEVRGPGGVDLLQLCFTRDLNACVPPRRGALVSGRSVYGAFLNERGECLDDAIVFQLAEERYLVVVNAGMGSVVAAHLEAHRGRMAAEVFDLSEKVGKVDLQGPASARILRAVLSAPESALPGMSYFSFKGHFDVASSRESEIRLTDGTPILLSRTGYTGEFGFEIFVRPERLVGLWESLLAAGRDLGLVPCGLAARDSLRVGAVLPLSHQDIGPWPFIRNPWEFALPFRPDRAGFTKDFVGAEALLGAADAEYTFPFVGFDPRKVADRGQAVVLDGSGKEIGSVLSCATDMGIGRHEGRIYSVVSPGRPQGFRPAGLSCGFLKVKPGLETGDTVALKDERRTVRVDVVADIRPDRTGRRPMRDML
ncbi:MAG: aminomethyltransferase family protein [bacterium]